MAWPDLLHPGTSDQRDLGGAQARVGRTRAPQVGGPRGAPSGAWGRGDGARATGRAASTRRRGHQALTSWPHARAAPRRRRRHGAGRQLRPVQAPPLLQAVDARVEPTARGEPWRPGAGPVTVRAAWPRLGQSGHHVRPPTVGPRLTALTASGQGTRNTRAGTSPPDRTAPLASRNAQVKAVQPRGPPVGSGDPKHKAVVGDCATGGRA